MNSELQRIKALLEESNSLLEQLNQLNSQEAKKLKKLGHLSTVNLKFLNSNEHDVVPVVNLYDNKYTVIVPGILGRIFKGTYLDFEEEALFRASVNELGKTKSDELLLFVKFNKSDETDGFPAHLHSVEERTYVIYGVVKDFHNDRDYTIGEVTISRPYMYHSFNPLTEGACIVAVAQGDLNTYLPKH